jgi:N-acetylneuraminate synthase
MKIGRFNSQDKNSLYVIAEIGVNHEGDLTLAKKLIKQATDGGAHAVKFQTYKAERLAAKESPSYWDTSKEATLSQFELFKKFDGFNESDYIELKNYCTELGIDFSSTPFDLESVDWLSKIVPFFKIASADITNFPLIRKVASKNLPVLLSTGASTIEEIKSAVNQLIKYGAKEICIMHCILNYPTSLSDANLNMIRDLIVNFPDCTIGYSDHTEPTEDFLVLTTAISLGAKVIEKHFTYNKNLPGNDHYHSMDMKDMKNFIQRANKLFEVLGNESKNYLQSEEISRSNARRSLHYRIDLNAGHCLQDLDFIALRPAHGISPSEIDNFIGKKLKTNVQAMDRLILEHFE